MRKTLLVISSIVVLFLMGCRGAETGTGDVGVTIWHDDDSGALTGQNIIGTGPFECDGEQHYVEWINEGPAIRIRQMEIWMGMGSTPADFWVWVSTSTGNTLGHTNWDRYTVPAAPHNLKYDYGQFYIPVAGGESIVLRYGCKLI